MTKFELEGIEYDIEQFDDLNYTIQKMSENLKKYGIEKSIRSQSFIRHLHLHIGFKLQKELDIPKENILFEANLKNKNVDIVIMENNKPKVLITIRSQTSSIKKNFTNNINSLQGEVVSLKSFYPTCKIGLVFLLKKIDLATKDDCTNYYEENIPKKLIPLIAPNHINKDRFDTAMIIIWDIKEDGTIYIDNQNIFTKIYNEENFIKELKNIILPQLIKAQFSLNELDLDNIKNFLSVKS